MTEQQTVARPPEQDSQTPWNRLKQAVGPRLRRLGSARPACRGRRRGVSDLEIVLCKARRPRERRYSERPDRGRRFRRSAVDDRAHSRNAFPRRRQRQCRRIHRDSRLRTTSRSRESGPRRAAAGGGESAVGVGPNRRPHTAIAREQLQMEQAKVDAEGRILQAREEMAAALADLADQEAAYQLALFDRDAYARLARTGAVSERQGKEAASKPLNRRRRVAAAKRRYEAACGALATAKATLVNPLFAGPEPRACASRSRSNRQR